MDDRLFVGKYPTGLVFADRHREENGDYRRVGFMPWNTLQLEPRPGAPAALLQEAAAIVETYRGREGQLEMISTTGQKVLLGPRAT